MAAGQPAIQKGRSITTILQSLLQRRHYRAFKNIVLYHKNPIDFLGRYLLKLGDYPSVQKLRCGNTELSLKLYSWHDVLTLNEIFFRNDYPVTRDDRVIVDFGSNIGLSAAYFLSASEKSFCYLFEPLPVNAARLRENLKKFGARYKLENVAVGLKDGEADFGFEETGRYGGIGLNTGSSLVVPTVDAVRIIKGVIAQHGVIDVLKIDIESLEMEILNAIPPELWSRIRKVFVEYSFTSAPLSETHQYRQHGSVAYFLPRAS